MRRALLLLSAALLLAGCGGAETVAPLPQSVEGTVPQETTTGGGGGGAEGDPAAGAQVYADAGCGTCHTLGDAGSSGTIGPNLDEAQPSLELAVDRVTNGQGAMPAFKDRLDEQQIQDVAAYVVQATGG